MKTDDLIAMLATNVEPIDRRPLGRTIGAALGAAAVISIGAMWLALGLRTELDDARHWTFLLLSLHHRNRHSGIRLSDQARPAAVIWALRRMASTDLVRAGALAGMVAGSISAMGYALHCTDDSLPFVALWYGGTIVLCTLAGGTLGPRLLRW